MAVDKVPLLVGKCVKMCPDEEFYLRRRESLLHRLEKGEGLEPVKEFHRSAAGREVTAEEVRPPCVLQQTVHYLINSVLGSDRSVDGYDFVNNRLRSVRQDLFIQQPSSNLALPVLEPIVRFYTWAAYWYLKTPGFDPHLNEIELLESLKQVIRLGEESSEWCHSHDMEAIYLVFALADPSVLARALALPKFIKSGQVMVAQRLSLAWFLGNYVSVIRLWRQLPALQAALLLARHLTSIRRYGLEVMSIAYSSKIQQTALSVVATHLGYLNEEAASVECAHYGLTIDGSKVHFRRADFNHNTKTVLARREDWLDIQLEKIGLATLILEPFDEATLWRSPY